MLQILERIAEKVGASIAGDPSLQVLEHATRPEKLVDQIEEVSNQTAAKK